MGRFPLSGGASGPSTARRGGGSSPSGKQLTIPLRWSPRRGQVGYDRQFGQWVIGVEGALNATNAH